MAKRIVGRYSFILIATAFAVLLSRNIIVESLVLLRDLPTPCFVIDIQALRRTAESPIPSSRDASNYFIPSIRLPDSGRLFHPLPIRSLQTNDNAFASTVIDVAFPMEEGQPSIGFLHTSVTRAREDATQADESIATFLAEIDLCPALCGTDNDPPAKLVLGLNNHHVGSYYWARSAGAGASMEAPGVSFECSKSDNSRGLLRWLDEGGPICCNSNDGKRSEWVNFLRVGDTVQLVPSNGQEAMVRMSDMFGSSGKTRIYGISAKGRPMGSEPEVICEWRQESG
jgi:hypothetical protein